MKYCLFFLLAGFSLVAQNQYPELDTPPLDIPLLLSGTFGELRSNHFHSGLDIRTQQKEGLPVMAVDDGYISRIKISSFGYGKAIYINHPNGYTSVYGHLQKGMGVIEEYINKEHYKKQSFEIEVFPKPNDLVVKKGQIIALSGNTGGSGGPHLHFEFRDTKTEKIINPMFFGMNKKIADTRQPVLTGIVGYPLGENSVLNKSERPVEITFSLQKDGSYLANKVLAKGKFGFGINSYDVSDKNYGKNGVYKIETSINGKKSFGITFDNFAFDEGRFVNAYMDYERFKRTNQRIQQLFVRKPYSLSLIEDAASNGIIEIKPNTTVMYTIVIEDFHQNKLYVTIPVHYAVDEPTLLKNEKKTDYFLNSVIENNYVKENVNVYVPENTFYDDLYLNFNVVDGVLTFQDMYTPIHKNITITFEDSTIPADLISKAIIANVDGKKPTYNKTTYKDGKFTTYTRNLGKFKMEYDTIAPRIVPLNIEEGKWISAQKDLQLKISDDFSGISSYNGYLNGKWILLDYDYKTQKITHDFKDSIVSEGRNDLKVVVVDNVGNSTIFETHFFRSQK
jgi:murein DD-endopeptidase MepM/ murein hydrolase activator NlpD